MNKRGNGEGNIRLREDGRWQASRVVTEPPAGRTATAPRRRSGHSRATRLPTHRATDAERDAAAASQPAPTMRRRRPPERRPPTSRPRRRR